MKTQLKRIVEEAAQIILARDSFEIEEKEGHANFVTTIDQQVQDLVFARLRALLPEARFIGEEQENEPLGDGYTWVVDPLDGTSNMIHDCRFSAISIALMKDRVPVVGVVYQPYSKELFYAEKGKGAWLNDSPIHVAANDFAHALTGFGTSPYNMELSQQSMEVALGFLRATTDLRRAGSAALDLAYVACGRLDIFFELNLKPWDYGAGALLVTEAGGSFEMPLQAQQDFGSIPCVLATNAVCHDDAKKLFMSYFPGK